MEDAVAGGCDRGVPVAGREARRGTRSEHEGHASQDWPTDVGKRFFGSRARSRGRRERKAMIIKTHPLSVKRQAELLEISRSNVYYLPTPTSVNDLALMLSLIHICRCRRLA